MLITKLASWTLKGRQLFVALLFVSAIGSGFSIYYYHKGFTEGSYEVRLQMEKAHSEVITAALVENSRQYELQIANLTDHYEKRLQASKASTNLDSKIQTAKISCEKVTHENDTSYQLSTDTVLMLNDIYSTASELYQRGTKGK